MAIDVELKTLKQSNTTWPSTFKASNRFPIVANRVFATLANAQAYVDDTAADASAYAGIVLAVVQDAIAKNNGVYYVQSHAVETDDLENYPNGVIPGKLIKVGGTETEIVENYSAAKELSKTLVVGQLIKITSDETIGESTYQKGFYIVEGAGVISSLSTSTGADDEIGALKTRVSDVELNKADLTDLTALTKTVSDNYNTYDAHAKDAFIHITQDERTIWNQAHTWSSGNTIEISSLKTLVNTKADASALTNYLLAEDAYDDTEVRGLITAESTARTEAFNTLSGAVDTKVSISDFSTLTGTVETNYNALNSLITAETAARAEAISTLTTTVNTKASNDDLTAHTTNGDIHVTTDDKNKWNKVVEDFNAFITGDTEAALNTLVDLQQWISEHGTEAQAMATAITANLESITSLTQTVDTISGKVDNNIAAITKNAEDIATKAAQSDLDALAIIVGNETDESGIFAKLNTLAGNVYTKEEADGKFLTGITVDAELSSTSSNPIQNKAVHAEFIKVRDEITSAVTGDVSAVLTNYLKKDQINTLNDIALYGDSSVSLQVLAGNGVEVTTDANAKTITVSPKISVADKNALTVDENGLFVQAIIIDGNDVEL